MSDEDDLQPLNLWNDLQAMLNLCEDKRRDYWKGRVDVPLVQSFLDQMESFSATILQGTDDLVSADSLADTPDAFWRQWEAHFDGFEEIWGRRKDTLDSIKDKLDSISVPKDKDIVKKDILDDIREDFRKSAKDEAAEQATEPPPADLPVLRAVWELLAIHLAYQATSSMIEEAATRLLRLARHVVKAKPGKPTLQFLKRVSRCYVWGFDAECVILCRSVIDTAFRDAVTDDICLQHEQPSPKWGFTLDQRIHVARRSGMITSDAGKAAYEVKERGNKAVHYDPEVTKDVLGTIKYTLLVLQQLSAAAPTAS